jgi:hypothetical protein
VKDLKGGEEAFSPDDLPPEALLVFYYFIKCEWHALQDKQVQC